MNEFDGIVVLGGGVREGGALPAWAERRFDRALEIDSQAPFLCLSAGTTHRPPPLNEQGFPYLESVAGAAYLLAKGAPASRIQVETVSYDTIGNAYFAKVLHIDPAEWRHLMVITSEFHMNRARAIFEWVFGMEPGKYTLQFEATPNDGLAGASLERRLQKEAEALAGLSVLVNKIRDLKSLHHWIFASHGAYTSEGWLTRRASEPDLVEIY